MRSAVSFTRTLVIETLPDTVVLRIQLNASYDGNPLHPDERVFPLDSDIEPSTLATCSAEDAVDILWRAGHVPEWINVTVAGVTRDATVVELLCCGRFTANEALLYHRGEGYPPFHVLGPTLPINWVEGQPYSLFHNASCRTQAELHALSEHARKVWSLGLQGAQFSDRDLVALPPLPLLEILEITGARSIGHGLARLDRMPMLRAIRFRLGPDSDLDLAHLPTLPTLRVLSIEGMTARTRGFEGIADRCPLLEDLALSATGAVEGPERWPGRLRAIRIAGPHLGCMPNLPADLESASVHLTGATRADLEQLFSNAKSIRSLHLDRTPLEDAFAFALIDRVKPRYANLVDTALSEDCLRRIAANHPSMKMHPRID